MKSYLIADTTREEREQIVADSVGNIDGLCDGCMRGIVDMYDDYIEGKRELKDINRAFSARYVKSGGGPEKEGCAFVPGGG